MSRGAGRVYRPKWNGRTSAVWWIDYGVRGQRFRESSGTTKKREAQRILRERLGGRETGRLTGAPDRVTVGDLKDLVVRQYDLDGLRSGRVMCGYWVHIERYFGAGERAVSITPARCDAYALARLGEGAARATVNRELAVLRRGFRLAVQKGMLATRPEFSIPQEHNARQGFFEAEDFAAVLAELPDYLKPLAEFAYLTGWRRGEVLRLTWANVDRDAEVIRIEVGTTKNREARTFPYRGLPALKAVIDGQWARREGLFVFHRNGQRIRDYYTAWHSACRRAAVQVVNGRDVVVRSALLERIPHDFRRTAVRNLVRAGVPERVAMQLTGHKTRAVFDRYNIVNEADLSEGVEKLERYGKRAASKAARASRGACVSSSAA
jgi:integrase